MQKITIDIFTDVLCVWAYSAQIRFDQLKIDFGDKLELRYRYIPIFAAAKQRIAKAWKDKGGFEGFNQSLREMAQHWEHVELHPRIWLDNVPESSSVPHLYLKAIQALEKEGMIASDPLPQHGNRSLCEAYAWRMRCSFFAEARNIGEIRTLDRIADSLGIPVVPVHEMLDNGTAHATLHEDLEARDQFMVPGSPTLVFNEGRQRLYGNVGYRIIEANIRELLSDKQSGLASWC